MQYLTDKFILLLLCLFGLLLFPAQTGGLPALLIAISVSALCSYFENWRRIALCASYCLAAIIFPQLALFLPAIAYDCRKLPQGYLRHCWVIPLIAAIPRLQPLSSMLILLVTFLSLLLENRTRTLKDIQDRFHQMTDITKETALHLEKKNTELMEKQDYEISLATLAERNRIAREIHDNVGHLLTRSILQVGALQVVHRQEPELSAQLEQLGGTLSVAMDNIRTSVHDLHEEAMDLNIQLCGLIEKFQFCPVTLNFDAGPLPKEIQYCFLAIVKEALSNIARHSQATRAVITVLEHPGLYQLIIGDNGAGEGHGIGPSSDARGIGIQNMRDRVEALNGIFRIDRSSGFKIFISIPKERGKS